jgi:hypothetical protein
MFKRVSSFRANSESEQLREPPLSMAVEGEEEVEINYAFLQI